MLGGYPDIYNSSCSYCQAVCEAPAVDSTILFFDGYNGKTVAWMYAIILVFIVVWQLLNKFVFRAKPPERRYPNKQNLNDSSMNDKLNLNDSKPVVYNLNRTVE